MLSLSKALWLAGLTVLGAIGAVVPLRQPEARSPDSAAPADGVYFQALLQRRATLGWTAEQHAAKVAEIAARFAHAYDSAPGLTLAVEIEEFYPNALRARAEIRMARDKLRSEVYLPAFSFDEPTFIFTLHNGQYTEWRAPGHGRPAQRLSRRFQPTEPADSELLGAADVAAYWCMLGGCLNTSIGAETFGVRVMRAHLEAGQYVDAQPWGAGEVCDVVLRELHASDEPYEAQVFYVDSRGFLVQRERYYAVDPRGQPRLAYRMRHERMLLGELPENTWR